MSRYTHIVGLVLIFVMCDHTTSQLQLILYIKLFLRLVVMVKNEIVEFQTRNHKINSLVKNK